MHSGAYGPGFKFLTDSALEGSVFIPGMLLLVLGLFGVVWFVLLGQFVFLAFIAVNLLRHSKLPCFAGRSDFWKKAKLTWSQIL